MRYAPAEAVLSIKNAVGNLVIVVLFVKLIT